MVTLKEPLCVDAPDDHFEDYLMVSVAKQNDFCVCWNRVETQIEQLEWK